MGQTFAFAWEAPFMIWLQNLLGAGLINILSHLSFLGEEIFLVAVLCLFYFGYDKEFGVAVCRTVLLSTVLSAMVKNIFVRRRPYFDNPGITVYRPVKAGADLMDIEAQGFSFPSGHSANVLAAFGAIARYRFFEGREKADDKRRRILVLLAILIPFLVGFSRVIAGVHYPTDVLFGWAFGLGMVFVVPFLYDRLGKNGFVITTLLIASVGIFFCHSSDYFSSLGLLYGFYLAIPFEKRFVRFEETTSPVVIALRTAGAGGLFLGLNVLLKLPFPVSFLENGSMAAHLVRTGRYMIIVFLVMGIYPMLFKVIRKWLTKDVKAQ